MNIKQWKIKIEPKTKLKYNIAITVHFFNLYHFIFLWSKICCLKVFILHLRDTNSDHYVICNVNATLAASYTYSV